MQFSSNHRKDGVGGQVVFPMLECWNPLGQVAIIAADVDKRRVSCRVALAVLKERYPDSAEDPMTVVEENRDELRAVARRLITERRFEEDGSICIGTDDF